MTPNEEATLLYIHSFSCYFIPPLFNPQNDSHTACPDLHRRFLCPSIHDLASSHLHSQLYFLSLLSLSNQEHMFHPHRPKIRTILQGQGFASRISKFESSWPNLYWNWYLPLLQLP